MKLYSHLTPCCRLCLNQFNVISFCFEFNKVLGTLLNISRIQGFLMSYASFMSWWIQYGQVTLIQFLFYYDRYQVVRLNNHVSRCDIGIKSNCACDIVNMRSWTMFGMVFVQEHVLGWESVVQQFNLLSYLNSSLIRGQLNVRLKLFGISCYLILVDFSKAIVSMLSQQRGLK